MERSGLRKESVVKFTRSDSTSRDTIAVIKPVREYLPASGTSSKRMGSIAKSHSNTPISATTWDRKRAPMAAPRIPSATPETIPDSAVLIKISSDAWAASG